MPEALIFDVDGTLAETEELRRRAFNETFAALGLPWNWTREEYRGPLRTTGGKERIARSSLMAVQTPALCAASWGQTAPDVFDVIAAGDEVAAKKPAPDVCHLALERLALSPGRCVAFEDSRNGLQSARAAGIACTRVFGRLEMISSLEITRGHQVRAVPSAASP